jgi:hypothetical protein
LFLIKNHPIGTTTPNSMITCGAAPQHTARLGYGQEPETGTFQQPSFVCTVVATSTGSRAQG